MSGSKRHKISRRRITWAAIEALGIQAMMHSGALIETRDGSRWQMLDSTWDNWALITAGVLK
jgi:hypothetical protein